MERDFIQWLKTRLPGHPLLRVGIGDDAAVLEWATRRDCIVSTDMLMEGVDFRLAEADPRKVGRKSLAVNLSDLAAMAAQPLAAVVAVALPRKGCMKLAKEIYEGMIPLAEEFGLVIAGGDTNTWKGPPVISITVIGSSPTRGPLLRSGAKVGDAVVVTGRFGGSILGKHFDFEPRVREALLLHEQYELHAAIDVSDGLSLDAARLAEASRVGIELDLDRVPIARAAHQLSAARNDGVTPLDHALADGEDFELVLAMPAEEARRAVLAQPLDAPLSQIGRVIEEPGLWRRTSDGGREAITPRGFEHPLD